MIADHPVLGPHKRVPVGGTLAVGPFPPAGSLAQVTTDPIYGPFVTLPLLLVVRELWS